MENKKVIELLKKENVELKKEITRLQNLLHKAGVEHASLIDAVEESPKNSYDLFPNRTISNDQLELFGSLFKGRTDVYAKRFVNKKGISGYAPQCDNFWEYGICPRRENSTIKCYECNNKKWTKLTRGTVKAHFAGKSEKADDVLGMYPILADNTCNFLVFDFDAKKDNKTSTLKSNAKTDNKWKADVDALRVICETQGVDVLVERSRSGKGAHVWMFFEEPISVSVARKFGAGILTSGAEYIEQKDFTSYDRMIPAQDFLKGGGLGNLIALPLQGKAISEGNTLFVDKNWEVIADQWMAMKNLKKLTKYIIEEKVQEWSDDRFLGILAHIDDEDEKNQNDSKKKTRPWKKKSKQLIKKDDISGKLNIITANQLYIDKDGVQPRALNRFRRLGAFSNPLFYKNQSIGVSNVNTPRIIQCSSDTDEYICLPRGCEEKLINLLNESDISFNIKDEKQRGTPIDVKFKGELYPEQMKAIDALMKYDYGILGAATGFGKTVVGAYIVSRLKINALILVHNREIMKNWIIDFEQFLDINEEIPEYETKRGKRKRKSVIGKIYSAHNSLNGIIDIAMITSLGKNDNINQIVKDYGLVIVDECHHAAAVTHENVLREINAKHVYGLTATPQREDGQENRIFFQLGPVRYRLTAKQRSEMQDFSHYVYPRFTRLVNPTNTEWKINDAYKALANDSYRNKQIIKDTVHCIENGRTPIVLTKFKDHAAELVSMIEGKVDKVFLLQGGRSNKERDRITDEMRQACKNESVVLVAIGKYVGEGFNFPRLDTMILAAPIAWQGIVEQYSGRLHRDYEGKSEVIIYDYVDIHIKVLERMYQKRLKAYKKIGYEVCTGIAIKDQKDSAIYDAKSYINLYSEDIQSAAAEIIISSPGLNESQIKETLRLLESAQLKGAKVTVMTIDPDEYPKERIEITKKLISALKNKGIHIKQVFSLHEHFAIIDKEIIWYGSINLLSRTRDDDNMIRIQNKEIAVELLEHYFSNDDNNSKTGG